MRDYVVKCDHPSVTEGAWPAEALAITEARWTVLAKHRAELVEKKRRHRRGVLAGSLEGAFTGRIRLSRKIAFSTMLPILDRWCAWELQYAYFLAQTVWAMPIEGPIERDTRQ